VGEGGGVAGSDPDGWKSEGEDRWVEGGAVGREGRREGGRIGGSRKLE
jgi:hypothetical protein